MEIRKITQSEYAVSEKLECIAFTYDRDFGKQDGPDSHPDRLGAFENGKMVACLDSFPYRVMLNGSEFGMAGVGNVASLPEERRKGHVSALLRLALEQSRERGDAVSFLFPFSNVYYRRFGYETAMLRNEVSIPVSAFKSFSPGGTMELYVPGESTEEIKEIYRDFISDKNMMSVRDDRAWEKLLGEDPYRSVRYVYVHRGESAKADGYVILKPREPELKIEEMAFRNHGALLGMFGFFYRFLGNFDTVRYDAPAFLDFHLLLPEPYDVKEKRSAVGMVRIVNAARALAAVNPPKSGEPVAIRVSDDFLEWNNGTFSVCLRNGKTCVRATDWAPDLACDVRTLAQLISGYVPLETCASLGRVQMNDRAEELSRMFSRMPPCLYDMF